MWIKKITPPGPKHKCHPPNPTLLVNWEKDIDVGSIWKCDECGQQWKLFDLLFFHPYVAPRYRKYPKWYDR